jgi:hypothetical protein
MGSDGGSSRRNSLSIRLESIAAKRGEPIKGSKKSATSLTSETPFEELGRGLVNLAVDGCHLLKD